MSANATQPRNATGIVDESIAGRKPCSSRQETAACWGGQNSVGAHSVSTPVVMVAGNHEYYDTVMTTEREAMQVAAAGTNVRMLDGHEAVIDDVRFLGCTLWTDFAVHIEVEAKLFGNSRMMSNPGKALKFVEHSLTDYQLIMMEDIRDDGDELEEPLMPIRRADRRLRGADTLAIHQWQRA
jgi:hypothetical protein